MNSGWRVVPIILKNVLLFLGVFLILNLPSVRKKYSAKKKLDQRGKDRPPGIPYKKRPKQWSGRENPRTLTPIIYGLTSIVHSATAQPEGGAHDIATRERIGQSEGILKHVNLIQNNSEK
jgi:hypothetical protein